MIRVLPNLAPRRTHHHSHRKKPLGHYSAAAFIDGPPFSGSAAVGQQIGDEKVACWEKDTWSGVLENVGYSELAGAKAWL